MKRFILIVAAVLGIAIAASAQPRAIGVRAGYGAELSYQHTLGGANFLEVDLGWWSTGINAALAYDFNIAPLGPFGFYAGPAADVWMFNADGTSGLGLGVGAQVGLEYDFSFPLQLSLDWRPLFTILPATGFGWNSIALGIRYRF
ncbi:MAG: hypothetical protein IKR15_08335 [Bacteroidales bacterium]|nr:hypothetical protein [Bacteroidales bacterium]